MTTDWKLSRRVFLGTAAAAATPLPNRAAESPAGLKLGVCSYSYTNKMTLAEAVEATKSLGVRAMNIKPEFHLPYDSSPAKIAEARKMLDDAGIQLAGTGTTYLTKMDEGEIRQRFEFNKALGSPLIVIGPTAQTLPLIEKCVKEFNIKVAIHNHGPSDKNFPTPQSALKLIREMDPRVGLCMDIGHTMRSGVDPAEAAKEAGARLLDMHTKDVKKEANGTWKAVVPGDGDIPMAALFRQLEKMHYAGYCNLEHELPNDDHRLANMQASFAYFHGLLAGLAV